MAIVNYSTEPRCRSEAGFTGNASITTTLVEQYQDEATGIMNNYIARRYNIANIVANNFTDSSTELLFQRIEELLCAGHLLNKEYGTDDLEDKTNGDKKINDAYKLMDDIVNGIIRLTDSNGNPYDSISTADGGAVFAFPTEDKIPDFQPEGKNFRVSQVR